MYRTPLAMLIEAREQLFNSICKPLANRLRIPDHVEFEYLKNRKQTLLCSSADFIIRGIRGLNWNVFRGLT